MSAVLVECMRPGRATDHIFSNFRGCRTRAGRASVLYSTIAKVSVGIISRAAAIPRPQSSLTNGMHGKPSPVRVDADGGLLAMRVTDPL